MPFSFRSTFRNEQQKEPRKRLRKTEPRSQSELRQIYQSGKPPPPVDQVLIVPREIRQVMPGYWENRSPKINKDKLGSRDEALGSHRPDIIAMRLPQERRPQEEKIRRTVYVQLRPDMRVERAPDLESVYEEVIEDEDGEEAAGKGKPETTKEPGSNNEPPTRGGDHFVFVSSRRPQLHHEPELLQARRVRHHSVSTMASHPSSTVDCRRSEADDVNDIRELRGRHERLLHLALDVLDEDEIWNYRAKPRVGSLDEEAVDVVSAALKNLRYKVEWYEAEFAGAAERFREAHGAPWARAR